MNIILFIVFGTWQQNKATYYERPIHILSYLSLFAYNQLQYDQKQIFFFISVRYHTFVAFIIVCVAYGLILWLNNGTCQCNQSLIWLKWLILSQFFHKIGLLNNIIKTILRGMGFAKILRNLAFGGGGKKVFAFAYVRWIIQIAHFKQEPMYINQASTNDKRI